MLSPVDIRQNRPQSGTPGKRKLPLAGGANLRVVQVSARPLIFAEAQYCPMDQISTLPSYQPQVLVGSAQELKTIARQSESGSLDLECLDRALFVVTDCRDMPLREEARTALWRELGVPIYEILLSAEGYPIATEYDAHDGWHIEDGVTFSPVGGQLWFQRGRAKGQGTGLTGVIEDAPCGCGARGKRILNAAMDYRDPVRHVAPQIA